ncbi:MAG: ABC transporter permease [Candidatus Odinarchaeia archaeon]
MAKNLSISVNDNITLSVYSNMGIPTLVEFTVIATISQFYGFPQYMFDIESLGYGNIQGAYVDISQLNELVGTNNVSTFFIKIVEGEDQLEVKENLEQQMEQYLNTFSIVSAKEWELEISNVIEQFSNVVYFFVGFALGVAGIGLATTMVVAVHERKQEIGILKSLGMSKNQILKMIMGEGIIITLIGMIVGIGGGLYIWYLFLDIVVSSSPDLFFELPFVIPLDIIIILIIICIVIALLASFYPAYKAMKLEIVDAIRKE